ncbi:MAG TPA: hypothetical protein VNA13_02815 [Xanthomonadales bacterium]|nr:hypothetical protein [Xanthomonadales bacterium]
MRENTPTGRLWESKKSLALKEFMKMDDLDEAKAAIVNVFTNRLSNPPRGERRFSQEEIDAQAQYVAHRFDYAAQKHEGKKRLTGEAYMFHPATVTFMTLSDPHIPINKLLEAGDTTLCHDILEDTHTLPRELRDEIGPDATRNVILLSKNMKAFDNSPETLQRELQGIGENPTTDEIELRKWAKRKDGTKREKIQFHMDELIKAPSLVIRARVYDRLHNLNTLPPIYDPNRSPEDQDKVDKIWSEIFPETKEFIRPLAISLGATGFALAMELRNAYREKKRQQ